VLEEIVDAKETMKHIFEASGTTKIVQKQKKYRIKNKAWM
jgi:hypothetical protein